MLTLSHGLTFLVHTLFGLYLGALMLRLMLQWARADFYNPLAQAMMKITDPLVLRLRRYIPGYGGQDWATILLLLGVKTLEMALLSWFSPTLPFFESAQSLMFLVAGVLSLVQLALSLMLWAIIARAVLSMVQPMALMNAPLGDILYQLTEPLLRRIRAYLPQTPTMDFSPLVACLALGFLSSMMG